jgi:hypothetical protein
LIHRCLHDTAQRITQGKIDVGATPWSAKIIRGKVHGTGNDENPTYMGMSWAALVLGGGEFFHSD